MFLENSEQVKRVEHFIRLGFERHRIYVKKELGMPKPWTKSRILQQYRFCNVFRRIDRTTVWLEENIIKKMQGSVDLWKFIILFRYISKVETYEQIYRSLPDLNDVRYQMRVMQKEKVPVFTSAFILNTGTSTGFTDRITYIFRLLSVYQDIGIDRYLHETLEYAYEGLRRASGVGPFMAYEYLTDFSYSLQHLANAPDINSWCVLGIGAVRGINRILFGEVSYHRHKNELELARTIYSHWKRYITQNLETEVEKTWNQILEVKPEVGKARVRKLYSPFLNLTMREVEHWLCEYDKYCRGGSKKRKYDGGQEWE